MAQNGTSSRVASLYAGALSGVIANVTLQPFDVLKTRVIVGNGQQRISADVTSIIKKNGIASLWRGALPTLVRVSIGAGLYFTTLNEAQSYLRKLNGLDDGAILSPSDMLVAGFVSRGAVGTLLTPITVVKTRIEASVCESCRSASTVSIIKNLYAEGSFSAFFRGMVPTLLRDAPFSGVYASSFSYMKEKLPVILPENCSPFYALAAKFSCGVISGALATLITQQPM
eukprot:CAMPEP_0113868114 /NCGR_PEP_ID=MMETSP0780_2-20120614/796_1 /TAXON_ID=652834 /ORGANISM="Palpitomonas bilix" /LENGTH=227 /DNA_ID=CAMNT_0000853135 /DNA_START=239 /DNA_END=923 /DNA_ORIENTATION=+ /assembly_acc=CAM_ASM_000599